jgi:hypothetical protein
VPHEERKKKGCVSMLLNPVEDQSGSCFATLHWIFSNRIPRKS